MPYLSIIIPAYNEERRIGKTLAATFEYLNAQSYKSEVIVVDDGSSDETAQVARKYEERANGRLRLIHNPGNRGKGYSVRNGMLQAVGKIRLFYDADLSTPLSEIAKVISPIAENRYDVVFGSRALNRKLIAMHQSFVRQTLGRTFNLAMRTILGLHFKDTQCGFKAFRDRAAQSIFEQQQIDGFGFDPETIFIAQKLGWRLLEAPVRWNHVEGSKVNLILTPVSMLLELLIIRLNHLTRKYNLRCEKI